jgi:hypothetical protein
MRVLVVLVLASIAACAPYAAEEPGDRLPNGLVLERVEFESRQEMVGMYVSLVPVPIALFGDGTACDCLDEDLTTLDLDELRARRPGVVGAWRGGDGDLEVTWSGDDGWHPLGDFSPGMKLGDGWDPQAMFERFESGGGAGAPAVFSSSRIAFAGGEFAIEAAGGVVSEGGSASSESWVQGTYSVEGWILALTYEDGTVEHLTALTDDEDFGGIWLSGTGYSKVD